MAGKNTAVYGIYANPETAEAAVDQLLRNGFSNASISVLLPDDESSRAFAHAKSTKAPEGTTTGATTGGLVGGAVGLLAGIGALAIPGVGPLIAAGPIMATLAGVGVGGAVGGLVGALVGMGIPEYEAKRYEGAVKSGGTLLSVHCDTSEQVDSAKRSLEETGAKDISSASEASSSKKEGAHSTYGDLSSGDNIQDRDLEDRRLSNDKTADVVVSDTAIEDDVAPNRNM
ncbi:general stress protein [Edaphobacter sp. HDX4]|uniref:general stress protein n=1 Tax=Edaphobacter sp. HDX4 TaxID=2794064 RepID=UPI002FE5DCC7